MELIEKATSAMKKFIKEKGIKIPKMGLIVKSVIAGAILLVVWFTLYLPVQLKVSKAESELEDFLNEIVQIESIVGTDLITGETRRLLHDKLAELEYKLPQKEEKALKGLFDLAKDFGVNILSIKPKPKEIAFDENRKEVKVESRILRIVSVSIKMKCSYEELVGYVGAIKRALPAFVTIKKLYADKDKLAKRITLNVTLNINLYFLS